MRYKKASLNSNLEEIAQLIYETDKFIYPFWFENYENWKSVLINMIKTKGNIFYYKNILVAEENGHIYGIIVYTDDKFINKYNYETLYLNKNFEYTIKNYIIPCAENIKLNTIQIHCVCVNSFYRNKHIGSNLLRRLFSLNKNKKFELCVLTDNLSAIHLYSKFGFKIISKPKGFNSPNKRKPLTYIMST